MKLKKHYLKVKKKRKVARTSLSKKSTTHKTSNKIAESIEAIEENCNDTIKDGVAWKQQVKQKIRDYFDKEKLLAGERKRSKWEIVIDVTLCLLVRFIFIVESSFWIYYTIGITGNRNLLWLMVLLILILLDGLYLSLFRHGYEHSWFLVSVFLFTIITLVFIWTTSLIKLTMPFNNCPDYTDELTYVNNFNLTVSFILSLIASTYLLNHVNNRNISVCVQ